VEKSAAAKFVFFNDHYIFYPNYFKLEHRHIGAPITIGTVNSLNVKYASMKKGLGRGKITLVFFGGRWVWFTP
jgi:hypothetical protein